LLLAAMAPETGRSVGGRESRSECDRVGVSVSWVPCWKEETFLCCFHRSCFAVGESRARE
jgi:hypothetical protein